MKKLLWMIFAILLLPVCARAGYIDIYEDTVINSNLDAIVTVHDSAQITVQPGGAATVFFLTDTSSALVYGGRASYRTYDSSVLKLYGSYFVPNSQSVSYFGNLAKIYVYGENFQMVPASDNHTSVLLQGNWPNGPEFNIYFRDMPQPFEQALGTNIFLVPEPATVVLMIMGVFLSKRRR